MKYTKLLLIISLLSGCSQGLNQSAFTPKPEDLLEDSRYEEKIKIIDELRVEQELKKFSDLIKESRVTRQYNGTKPIVIEVERIRPEEGEIILDENGEELIDPVHDKVRVEEYYIIEGEVVETLPVEADSKPIKIEPSEEYDGPDIPTEDDVEVEYIEEPEDLSEEKKDLVEDSIVDKKSSLAPVDSVRPTKRPADKEEQTHKPVEDKKLAPEGVMAENLVNEEPLPKPIQPKLKIDESIKKDEKPAGEIKVTKAKFTPSVLTRISFPQFRDPATEGETLGSVVEETKPGLETIRPKKKPASVVAEIKEEETEELHKEKSKTVLSSSIRPKIRPENLIAEKKEEPLEEKNQEDTLEVSESSSALTSSLRPKARPDNLKSSLAVTSSLRPKARPTPKKEEEAVDLEGGEKVVKAAFAISASPRNKSLMLAAWDKRKAGAEYTKITIEALERNGANLLDPNMKMNSGGYSRYCKKYNTLDREDRIKFWLMFISGLSERESGFDPTTKFKEGFKDAHGTIYSRGLLQMSIRSVNQSAYACNIKVAQDLHKPEVNINCAVKIMNFWVKTDKAIYGHRPKEKRKWRGVGRYWAPIRLEKYSGKKLAKHQKLGDDINNMDICR